MLSQIAGIADLIAAAAIVVSLLFVACEMRATRKQSELSNWREVLQTMTEYKAQPNDAVLATLFGGRKRACENGSCPTHSV